MIDIKYYEILLIENGIFYINLYSSAYDVNPVKLRLSKDEFEKFMYDKLEK